MALHPDIVCFLFFSLSAGLLKPMMSAVRVGVEFDPFIQIFTNPYCGLFEIAGSAISDGRRGPNHNVLTPSDPRILEIDRGNLCSSSSERVCGIQPGGSIYAWPPRRG
ncbi:hypothetical protein BGW80DRAFT_1316410, partial [Lactifluus volemus]